MNKIAKIKELEKQINKLSLEKYHLVEDEEDTIQKPRCRKMVGWCLASTYKDNRFAKILEVVEPKNRQFYFLMEEIHTNEHGEAHICTTSTYPYLNKEWWDTEVPISGWTKITEEKYQNEKAKMFAEMSSRNKLRKFLLKNNL